MKKKRFHYFIRGYRWAPENFGASKGLTKDSRKAIPLTLDERREVGILSLTKGPDAAIGYVKHTERARERQRRKMITYGFLSKEVSGRFVYCPQLSFRADASIDERLRVFKKIRAILEETDGRVVTSTECELDGQYRPNLFMERRGYGAPARGREDGEPKKAVPRARPGSSSPQRGSGSTPSQSERRTTRTTDAPAKVGDIPTVKGRLAALRAASEGMKEPGKAPQRQAPKRPPQTR